MPFNLICCALQTHLYLAASCWPVCGVSKFGSSPVLPWLPARSSAVAVRTESLLSMAFLPFKPFFCFLLGGCKVNNADKVSLCYNRASAWSYSASRAQFQARKTLAQLGS